MLETKVCQTHGEITTRRVATHQNGFSVGAQGGKVLQHPIIGKETFFYGSEKC